MREESRTMWDYMDIDEQREIVADAMARDFFGKMKISDMNGIVKGLCAMFSEEDEIFDAMVERYDDEIDDECYDRYKEQEYEYRINSDCMGYCR